MHKFNGILKNDIFFCVGLEQADDNVVVLSLCYSCQVCYVTKKG